MDKQLMTFEFETDEGIVTINADEELGELTPDEFILATKYLALCGFEVEPAHAGAALLILLSRKVSLSPDELLKRVL
jgi:hypothetical protein